MSDGAPDEPNLASAAWCVYVLRSLVREVTYVGIAKDLEARLSQHNGLLPGGAKSTRGSRPWIVENQLGPYGSRAEAQAIEYRVKQLPAADRLVASPGDFPDVPAQR